MSSGTNRRATRTALRPLVLPVFVPAAVFGIGQSAAVPVIAFHARDLGGSLTVAGLVVALAGVGQVLGDIPAGRIVRRYGERRTVLGGSFAGAVGAALCLFAWHVWALAAGVLLLGVANAVWGLARHAYVADAVPLALRARALSAMAGSSRAGTFVGPFLGAAAVAGFGPRGGFAIQLAGIVLAAALMAALPDDGRPLGRRDPAAVRVPLLSDHRHLFSTLGVATMMTGAARAGRTAVLPLWAAHLGVDAATTSLVFGVAAGLEVLAAYPAGRLMDLRGRRFVAVPCLTLLGLGYLLLPATAGVVSLTAVAVVMGIGNGLGSGLVMTLAADLAPADRRAEFLAAWRLCHDTGMAAGPSAVSALSAVASLAVGILAVGGLCLAGAACYARWLPRYLPAPPRSR